MYLPKCRRKEQDCFARMPLGQCSILCKAYKKGEPCPFYKPASEVSAQEILDAIKSYKLSHGSDNCSEDDEEDEDDDAEGED